MPDREKVIKAINICLGLGKCDDCGYRIKFGYSMMDCRKPMMRDALALLIEQEESIPVSWLKEKLEGHPELPYAVTDGINNVLDLWESR